MDNAVALVQAYLRVNGYFTVAEYPVLEVSARKQVRTVTDLDILAIRLAHEPADDGHTPDPALGVIPGTADMIVGEVKEGSPKFNRAMRDPEVLIAAFTRFGCCPPDAAGDLVDELLRRGSVVAPAGHVIRTVAFGNPGHSAAGAHRHVVPLDHIASYLQEHLRTHWNVVGRTQVKDGVLGLLLLLEKSRRAAQNRGAATSVGAERSSR